MQRRSFFASDCSQCRSPRGKGTAAAKDVRKRSEIRMAGNKTLVPGAKDALNRFKMEAANEVGVNLKQGYNGDLTSRQAGSVGGQMVKKMIQAYENGMK